MAELWVDGGGRCRGGGATAAAATVNESREGEREWQSERGGELVRSPTRPGWDMDAAASTRGGHASARLCRQSDMVKGLLAGQQPIGAFPFINKTA